MLEDYFILNRSMSPNIMVFLLNFIKNQELVTVNQWNIQFVGIEIKKLDYNNKILDFEYYPGLENYVTKDD